MMRRALPSFLVLAALALPGAPALASTKDESVHVVEQGETLNGIANRAGVAASAIVKANGLKEPYVVKVGQKLTIPRAAACLLYTSPSPRDRG